MKTENEYFLIKHFSFIDAGIPAAMGDRTISVYETLRRFVWRSKHTGSKLNKENFTGKKLAAQVSQKKLATLLGLSRPTILKALKVLHECRWIEIEKSENPTDTVVYVLGEWVESSKKLRSEMMYADAICMDLMEYLKGIAAERRGDEKSEIEASISDIPDEERVELTREYLGRRKGKVLELEVEKFFTAGVNILYTECKDSLHRVERKFTHKVENLKCREFENVEKEKEHPSGGAPRASGPVDSLPRRAEGDGERLTGNTFKISEPTEINEQEIPTISNPTDLDFKNQKPRAGDAAQRAKQRAEASVIAAREKSHAARDLNLKRESARKRALMNLAGTAGVNDPRYKRLVTSLQRDFRREYKIAFPEAPLAHWAGKEYGQIKQLVEMYSGEEVSAGLDYLVLNWERISKRFGRKAGVPTPGFLLTFHSDLIPEAVRWAQVSDVKREYDEWMKANPYTLDLPPELERRYEGVRRELEALGLA